VARATDHIRSAQHQPAQPRLIVPAYFHPALRPELWRSLAEHADQVRLVILNVASGPGAAPDRAFGAVASHLHRAGVAMAGYVDTGYGHRPPAGALADIGRYVDWYGVTGICFDRAAATAEHLGYYAMLASRSRAMGAGVVMFNHGTHPSRHYAEHADVLGTFEGPWRAYRHLAVPRWTRSWPASMFYHVVYAVPAGRLGDAFRLATHRGAGSVYITDHSGGNPYDRLPAGGLGAGAWQARR
jgi:Spherulation-specific family 4